MSKVTRKKPNEKFILINFDGQSKFTDIHFADWVADRDDVIYAGDHPRFPNSARVVMKSDNYDFDKISQEITDKLTEFGLKLINILETTTFYPKLEEGWRDQP